MRVFYNCDNNYVWLMGISVISLFENHKHLPEVTVYLLGKDISEENREKLAEIAQKYNRSIHIIEIQKLDLPQSLLQNRWPISAFARLYAGSMLPEGIERVVYIDCDTIINGDISELERLDMGGHIICGVKECVGRYYRKNIGLSDSSNYINAGILLIQLDKLREIDVALSIRQFVEEYEQYIHYADQDILNGAFGERIGILPKKYNVMTLDVAHTYDEILMLRRPVGFYSREDIQEAAAHPLIIHYTTNLRIVRPWFRKADHPLKAPFQKYLKLSPWADRQLQDMVFAAKESRIIELVEKLPKWISYRMLGFMHGCLKPLSVSLKAKGKNRNESNGHDHNPHV